MGRIHKGVIGGGSTLGQKGIWIPSATLTINYIYVTTDNSIYVTSDNEIYLTIN